MGPGEKQNSYFTTERTNPHTWHNKTHPPYPSLSPTSHTFQHSPFLFVRTHHTLQHSPFLFVCTSYSLQHSPFLILWPPYSLQHSPFLILWPPYSLQHSPFLFVCTSYSLRHSPFICFSLTLPLLSLPPTLPLHLLLSNTPPPFPLAHFIFCTPHDLKKKILSSFICKMFGLVSQNIIV